MTIAFLGDSITLGYGLDRKESRYSALVSRELGMEERNFGITGTLVAKAGLNRADGKDFLSRVSLIDDADVAVVFGGTNDYFWSDHPIDGRTDGAFSVAVRRLAEHVRDKRAGRLTLFVTPYPHNGIGNFLGGADWRDSNRHDTEARNFNGHTLADYADAIAAVCSEHGIPCLRLFDNFGFDWREHTIDGCHPNEEGHRLIARAVVEKLRALGV